jgi:glucose uptake protein GlcU
MTNMFNYSVILIALGAVVGLTMAVQHFKGRTPPKAGVAILHGLLAGTGVILLLLGARDLGFATPHTWALVLFVIAALGGLYLVSFHMRQKPLPNAVIVVHGLVAVVAFLVLLTAVYLLP